MIKLRIHILALFVVVVVCASSHAQEDLETQNQVWPELDAFVHLNPKLRLFFLATFSKESDSRAPFEGQVGAHIDYIVNKNLILRTGYRYGHSLGDTNDPFSEHRWITEQTLRLPMTWNLLLSDRNRQDFRWVDGEYSFRYRNRLTLEREFVVKNRSLTPYASGELYYNTRFDTWNRNRYAFGLQISIARRGPALHLLSPRKNVVIDIYYMRQNDSRSLPYHVNALGLVTFLYF